MKTKSSLLAALGVLALASQAFSQNATTTPVGAMTYEFPATSVLTTAGFSVPLLGNTAAAGIVDSVSADSVSTIGTNWTANQFAGTTPYYVQFTSGAQVGRNIRVVSNTASTLTLDTSDGSTQVLPLTAPSYAVATGDTFILTDGYTLGSLLGDSVGDLVFSGGTSGSNADTVAIYNPLTARVEYFLFNTTLGYWQRSGSTANQNLKILRPGESVLVTRKAGRGAVALTVTGQVPTVDPVIILKGSISTLRIGSLLPADITLAGLDLGPNWVKSDTASMADVVSLYNPGTSKWVNYYQKANSVWTRSGTTTDASNTPVPAGSMVSFLKRAAVTGAQSVFSVPLPYTLD